LLGSKMMSTLQKIAKITQAVLDQVTGADLPTLYYHPHGEIRRVLDYLPQLKEKYRPTPWLSNTHAHLLYFDLIKKKTIRSSMIGLINSLCKMAVSPQLLGWVMTYLQILPQLF